MICSFSSRVGLDSHAPYLPYLFMKRWRLLALLALLLTASACGGSSGLNRLLEPGDITD